MSTNKASYKIGGLKGTHCRDRIQNVLSDLEGISNVNVDLSSSQITLDYDNSVIASGYIEETLQTLGYSIQG
ncbi:MAG TPA: heavy-metal-associated domain-containing protein [Negativicutes bacterium]|jgi:copper chaperone CopZ